MLLLHGLGGSRLSWEDALAGLADRHRCVAWDLPGYGAAAPLAREPTFPALADALVALAEAAELDRPHLVGISFGGMIAQHAVLAHPGRFRSLTLLATSPAFGLDGTLPADWRQARLAPLDAGQEPRDFSAAVLRMIAGPSISATALAGQQAAFDRITSGALRRSIDCLVTHDLRGRLAVIDVPALVLVGELDTETPPAYAEALAAEVPGARLVTIGGAGHLLNAEAPAEVNRLLAEHFAATDRA